MVRQLGIILLSLLGLSHLALANEPACNSNITALYSSHFDPIKQGELELAMEEKPGRSPASLPSLAPLAYEILNSHQAILKAKKRELQKILNHARTNKITWMAVELPDADVQQMRGQEKEQIDIFVGKLIHRAVDKSSAEDLALLTYDSVHFAVATEPRLFSNIRLIGLEDPKTHADSLTQAEELDRLQRELRRKNPKLAPALARNDKEVGYILGEKNLKRSPAQEKSVQAFPDTKSQLLARQRLIAARKLVQLSEERDKKTAAKLKELAAEPGLFTMGEAHAKHLSQLLPKPCP